MKKATASNATYGGATIGKNRKAAKPGSLKRRVKHPDFLMNLERLGYSETVGARMLQKFHDSLS